MQNVFEMESFLKTFQKYLTDLKVPLL